MCLANAIFNFFVFLGKARAVPRQSADEYQLYPQSKEWCDGDARAFTAWTRTLCRRGVAC